MTRRERRRIAEEKTATLKAEKTANAENFTGYICKTCGRPSPAGIGYAVEIWGYSCITESTDKCGPHA